MLVLTHGVCLGIQCVGVFACLLACVRARVWLAPSQKNGVVVWCLVFLFFRQDGKTHQVCVHDHDHRLIGVSQA